MQFRYPVNLNFYAANEVVAEFPDVPEAISCGISKEEALHNASDALAEAIAGRINRDENIPLPSKMSGSYYVPLPLQIALKTALNIEIRKQGLTKVKLAKLLGCDEKVVRRILDPKYNTPLKKIEETSLRLNLELAIESNIISTEPEFKMEVLPFIPSDTKTDEKASQQEIEKEVGYNIYFNTNLKYTLSSGLQNYSDDCKSVIAYPKHELRH